MVTLEAGALNDAQAKAVQLSAMLALITHGGPDAAGNFEAVGAGVRSTYLWACADMARDLSSLLDTIPAA